MFSFFDKLFHEFECPNPKCRHKFYGLSRGLFTRMKLSVPSVAHAKPSTDQRAIPANLAGRFRDGRVASS
jgi:hypothetical protein